MCRYTGKIAPYTDKCWTYTDEMCRYTDEITPYTGKIAPYTDKCWTYTDEVSTKYSKIQHLYNRIIYNYGEVFGPYNEIWRSFNVVGGSFDVIRLFWYFNMCQDGRSEAPEIINIQIFLNDSIFVRIRSMSTGKPLCAFFKYHPDIGENIFIEIDNFFYELRVKAGVFFYKDFSLPENFRKNEPFKIIHIHNIHFAAEPAGQGELEINKILSAEYRVTCYSYINIAIFP